MSVEHQTKDVHYINLKGFKSKWDGWRKVVESSETSYKIFLNIENEIKGVN